MPQVLVAKEIRAFHRAFGRGHTGEYIGVELMADTVVEELLALVVQTVVVADADTATKMPKPFLVVIPGRISLNMGYGMQLFVELLEEHAFLKTPA